MADLDDFFAKKDRKKSSKGKKFATTEELAKKLEDTSKKIDVKPRRDRIQNLTNSEAGEESNNHEQINEVDEWKEFEEDDVQKDYSNLKIGQLVISEEEQNQLNDYDGGSEGQSDGEGNSENSDRRPSGPWNKSNSSEQHPAQPAQVEEVKSKSTSSVYVSPAFKHQVGSQSLSGAAARNRNRVAPDLSNEEYFPSLGATTKAELLAKKKIDANFEEVKHGGRLQRATDLPSNAPVTIGNRFNSLAD